MSEEEKKPEGDGTEKISWSHDLGGPAYSAVAVLAQRRHGGSVHVFPVIVRAPSKDEALGRVYRDVRGCLDHSRWDFQLAAAEFVPDIPRGEPLEQVPGKPEGGPYR